MKNAKEKVGSMKKWKSQNLKIPSIFKKNYQIGIKCRWDTLEEKICELEDGSVENVKTEAQMGKREKWIRPHVQ